MHGRIWKPLAFSSPGGWRGGVVGISQKKGSPERERTVHQGGHVASGQGSEKTLKGYESSIQLDRGHWFKKDLDC
jgi:hypothetical protein